jgi:hypothetical protein
MLNITGTIVVHCENQHKYNNKKRAVSIKDKTLTNKMLTYLNKDLYDETNLKQKHKKGYCKLIRLKIEIAFESCMKHDNNNVA